MISVDRLIQFAMEDYPNDDEKEEMAVLRQTKPILRDEILTCYQYLREKGLLEEYKSYRG